MTTGPELVPLDLSDVERWAGRPLGGIRLREPMTVMDVRRWVQAMENPNPLHFDDDYAAESAIGRIVAPQSFTAWWCRGQGAIAATWGELPGAHLAHVADEWWFYGPRLFPGDKVHCDQMAFDHRLTTTGFAGPSLFQRGDTTYVNQHGELVAKQRTTCLRYLPENTRRIAAAKGAGAANSAEGSAGDALVDPDLAAEERLDYCRSVRVHASRTIEDVRSADGMVRGLIGPHSVLSFATHWRARPDYVWGAWEEGVDFPIGYPQGTAFADMLVEKEALALDLRRGDGLYRGPSAAHTDREQAQRIGMPREFAYGFAMSAWVMDYVANWAGETGTVVHCTMQHRAPALVGDVSYIDGTVASTDPDPLHPGFGVATIDVVMSSQRGDQQVVGRFEVRLPWGS